MAQAFVFFTLMALEDTDTEVPIPESALKAGNFKVLVEKQMKKQVNENKMLKKRYCRVRKRGGGFVDVSLSSDYLYFDLKANRIVQPTV